MSIMLTKGKVALAVLAVALLVPATAYATHVFSDVPDDAFYADAVEWAAENDITTGVAPDRFAPDEAVTRGQSVTFLHRYDDYVRDRMVLEQTVAYDSDESFGDVVYQSTTATDIGLSATVVIPAGRTGVVEATFAAESSCFGGDGDSDWCEIDILRDGTNIGVGDFAFDSTDNGTETVESWEGHSATRITEELPAGTYEFTVAASVSDGDDPTPLSFRLDERVLTAEVRITG